MSPAARAGAAWVGTTALLCALVVPARSLGALRMEWQPALAASEPWRAFTAVGVHYSLLHLGANLAGALLVAALGVAARTPGAGAAAWLVAWPLTQLGLLLQPALLRYGGLSGVLHAGVAVVATQLLLTAHGGRRAVGAGIAIGLVVKLLLESPWGPPLRHPAGWDIAVAPFAHLSGCVAGALCGGLVFGKRRRQVA